VLYIRAADLGQPEAFCGGRLVYSLCQVKSRLLRQLCREDDCDSLYVTHPANRSHWHSTSRLRDFATPAQAFSSHANLFGWNSLTDEAFPHGSDVKNRYELFVFTVESR